MVAVSKTMLRYEGPMMRVRDPRQLLAEQQEVLKTVWSAHR